MVGDDDGRRDSSQLTMVIGGTVVGWSVVSNQRWSNDERWSSGGPTMVKMKSSGWVVVRRRSVTALRSKVG
ncbi:hypothetical protein MA16_Dca019806 [Dendrobium catenatum]|uniref:Uncharacterized protein n=1 Tax=Dendrobium catenatum TaxID=906689 RepID=A0A2I0WEK2_9ASPA|nr:hypothetical protein MA16_Dca019806 [Dendrobium catenatum]